MKYITMLVLMSSVLFGETLMSVLNNLSPNQEKIMFATFKEGKKHDLEMTMTAICWEESQFGKYMVNIADPSFGYFHNSVKTIQSRHKADNWNTSRLIERLLFDYKFGFSEALTEVKFWQGVYKDEPRSWSKMVSSYNAGFKYKNGRRYLERIKRKIKALKSYMAVREML